MQNRYAGDVGDFGKLGLLRQLTSSQLDIGVNWYLAPDESHNADGKHIGYITDTRYNGCDKSLRNSLKKIVNGQRSVSALETMELVPNAVYYHEVLYSPSRTFSRRDWHIKALEMLSSADIVFLDPDNGLLVKSVFAGSAKSNKYVISNEIVDYFAAGKSVIIYNHRCREQESVYLQRFAWMHENSILKDAVITGVTFIRGTVRDYIFTLQPSHAARIMGCWIICYKAPGETTSQNSIYPVDLSLPKRPLFLSKLLSLSHKKLEEDKAMKKGLTELVFILDKSGSMGGLETDTIGGYNTMLKKQQTVDGECHITTVLFDNDYELLHDRIDIKAVSPITEKEYQVGGSTALLDAIGKTIHKIGNVQRHTADDYCAEKVMFVIITDGEENSSREYSSDKVKAQIERQKGKYGWEFIFLGANIDAVQTASHFGIAPDRVQNYHADNKGVELNFRVMSEAVATFRECADIPKSWNDEIQKDYEQRGGRK